MEEGRTIIEGKSKKDRSYFIRYPKKGDEEAMLSYINTLSQEQTYVLMQGKQKTIEEEKKFLDDSLKNIIEQNGIVLLVFVGDTLIGIASLDMQTEAASHVGGIGITIAMGYRGEGIGKILMQFLLDEGENCIPHLRIITLGVYEDNLPAVEMYKKLGFQDFGKLPEGLFRKDKYSNELFMYKKIR